MRERDRDRQTNRQTDTQTDRHRERERGGGGIVLSIMGFVFPEEWFQEMKSVTPNQTWNMNQM